MNETVTNFTNEHPLVAAAAKGFVVGAINAVATTLAVAGMDKLTKKIQARRSVKETTN